VLGTKELDPFSPNPWWFLGPFGPRTWCRSGNKSWRPLGLSSAWSWCWTLGMLVFFGRKRYPLVWLFDIAMENDPFIDGLPIKNGDFL